MRDLFIVEIHRLFGTITVLLKYRSIGSFTFTFTFKVIQGHRIWY